MQPEPLSEAEIAAMANIVLDERTAAQQRIAELEVIIADSRAVEVVWHNCDKGHEWPQQSVLSAMRCPWCQQYRIAELEAAIRRQGWWRH